MGSLFLIKIWTHISPIIPFLLDMIKTNMDSFQSSISGEVNGTKNKAGWN